MTTIPTIVITPSAAAQAYTRTGSSDVGGDVGASFGAAFSHALDDAVQTGRTADDQTMKALSGGGDLTQVVTALSHAEMTMQTVTVLRDRMVQAYQDILKMPI